MKLEGKVIIITGASSGIGKEIALLFAKEGAKVVAAARRADKLEDLVAEASHFTGEIYAISSDVGIEEEVDRLVDETVAKYGTVDIVINNAGVLDNYQSPENVDEAVWRKVFDVNVDSIMRMTRKVIPIMKAKKSGVIINTASVGGLFGMRGGLGYVASKHAVVGMTKHIGYAYADEGIRCVAVAPGSIATEIGNKVSNPDMGTLDKLMAGVSNFQHFGKPEDLAKTYLFLASDDANFVNGTTIVVDGGWTAF